MARPTVSAGYRHTCAIKTDGTPTCWGFDFFGQSDVPAGTGTVTAISAGYYNTCAIKTDGTPTCWGYDGAGESTVPPGTGTVTAIDGGTFDMCAIKTDGTPVCWGDNSYGQTTIPAGTGTVTAISAGENFTCAIKTDGTPTCWGRNNLGQTTIPPGTGTVTAIAAGGDHACAIKTDGTPTCWGRNDYGQATVPPGTGTVAAISAGLQHTCAIKSDGTPTCWGNGGSQETNIPPGTGTVTAISAGGFFTCAVKTDGTVTCWGTNFDGQLGAAPATPAPAPPSPALVGASYSHTFTSSTGTPPGTFSAPPADLPPGLTLSAAGVLSGIPTTAGMYTFTVTVSDGVFADASATFTITVIDDTDAPTTTASAANADASPYTFGTWTNQNVTVTLTATDTGSGVATTYYDVDDPSCSDATPGNCQTYSGPFTITSTGMHTVTYFSKDNAGNTETAHTAQVWIDHSLPVTSITLDPATPDVNGWYVFAVKPTVSAGDGGGSGLTQTRCVLDPASPPASFNDLPAGPCPYLAAEPVRPHRGHPHALGRQQGRRAATPTSSASPSRSTRRAPVAQVSPLAMFQGAATFPVSWSATDNLSGVKNYDVRYRQAASNGSFGGYTTWFSHTTSTSAAFTAPAGATTCFSARATDNAGWTSVGLVGRAVHDGAARRPGTDPHRPLVDGHRHGLLRARRQPLDHRGQLALGRDARQHDRRARHQAARRRPDPAALERQHAGDGEPQRRERPEAAARDVHAPGRAVRDALDRPDRLRHRRHRRRRRLQDQLSRDDRPAAPWRPAGCRFTSCADRRSFGRKNLPEPIRIRIAPGGQARGGTQMRSKRAWGVAIPVMVGIAAVTAVAVSGSSRSAVQRTATRSARTSTRAAWPTRSAKGDTTLRGQVPLVVSSKTAAYLRPHARNAEVRLNFSLPLRDRAGLDALIAQEGRTHHYQSRDELYARFSPPQAQVTALSSWLVSNGFRITHVGADRLTLGAAAPTSVVERALHVRLNDYVHPATTFRGMRVPAYAFFANTTAPRVPARLGIQTIAGLSDIDRFYTLRAARLRPPRVHARRRRLRR